MDIKALLVFLAVGAVAGLLASLVVGGGGLLSCTALAANALSPSTKVIAAEPAGADDAKWNSRHND